MLWAMRFSSPSSVGAPVLGLAEKRGKLLLEIATRMQCPLLTIRLVLQRSMLSSTTWPGSINSGFANELQSLAIGRYPSIDGVNVVGECLWIGVNVLNTGIGGGRPGERRRRLHQKMGRVFLVRHRRELKILEQHRLAGRAILIDLRLQPPIGLITPPPAQHDQRDDQNADAEQNALEPPVTRGDRLSVGVSRGEW